jgi:hypothetical protein
MASTTLPLTISQALPNIAKPSKIEVMINPTPMLDVVKVATSSRKRITLNPKIALVLRHI